jgi:hypothetical protein
VLIASVYPIWAIKGCEMCTAECYGDACRCPCHGEHIEAGDLQVVREAGPVALAEGMTNLRPVAGGCA